MGGKKKENLGVSKKENKYCEQFNVVCLLELFIDFNMLFILLILFNYSNFIQKAKIFGENKIFIYKCGRGFIYA